MGHQEFCENWDSLCREYGRAEVERMYSEDPTWGGFMVGDEFDDDFNPKPMQSYRPFNKLAFRLPVGSRNRKPLKSFQRPPRVIHRHRRLANGKIVMDGSPIGFVADYCPICDGSSVVTYVDPEFINFKCIQCGKTWSRPTHTVEFDMQRGIVQPDIVNTVAGAYQKAVKKASAKRRVKPTKRKQTPTRRRSNAKKSSKKK